MSDKNLKFAVLGTGNSGQCFAADVALKGYSIFAVLLSAFQPLTVNVQQSTQQTL